MDSQRLLQLIQQGENQTIEFKESRNQLNRDVFETVCAFLNRHGGHLFLGVSDSKETVGVDEAHIENIKMNFITSMNNSNKISPTFFLSIEDVIIEGKHILYVYVPESSQVHRCNGKIYDRSGDADLNITEHTNQVAALYARKQNTYTENQIFPHAHLSDLDLSLFTKVRKLVAFQRPDHPWIQMDELEILKSAGLYLKDVVSGKEGITLAGILLFGKEQTILSALPHHKTDAILRRNNIDRYDDRDDIRVNLLDSYERLMQFVSKHLNDSFYLEGDVRINVRDKLFREIVSNSLVHREYSQPFPAKFVIEKDRVYVENGNKPHYAGVIDPHNFSPYPKNPTIARFFKEIGRVDELGSGIRNTTKYNKIYSGAQPKFIEGNIFQTIIPILSPSDQAGDYVGDQASDHGENTFKESQTRYLSGLTDLQKKAILYCSQPRSRQQIGQHIGILSPRYLREHVLHPLIEKGYLQLTLPTKPKSPNQQYVSIPPKK